MSRFNRSRWGVTRSGVQAALQHLRKRLRADAESRLIDCEEDRTLRAVLVGMLRGGRALGSLLGLIRERAPHGTADLTGGVPLWSLGKAYPTRETSWEGGVAWRYCRKSEHGGDRG